MADNEATKQEQTTEQTQTQTEETSSREMSFVDSVLGGETEVEKTEAYHSPDTTENNDSNVSEEESSLADMFIRENEEEKTETSSETPAEKADSAEEKKTEDTSSKPENVPTRMEEEIAKLQKRLHDTQEMMHKATGDRARLQKELNALKAKKEDTDDWFSEEDEANEKAKIEELRKTESDIDENASTVKQIEERVNVMAWDDAVNKTKNECPDFEKVVYDGFAPLIDPLTGDAEMKTKWDNALKELKSAGKTADPKFVYQFAKKELELMEIAKDPESYRAKIRAEIENEKKNPVNSETKQNDTASNGSTIPTGKAGLDLLNSAVGPADTSTESNSFVDSVFRE